MNAPATGTVDQYSFWRRRLAGEVVPVHDGECQAGFYRDGDKAVAVWFKDDGTLRCRVGGIDIDANQAMDRWPFISKRPVSHDDYKARLAAGTWPGESAVVTQSNNAPADDSFEGIQAQIDELAREAERLMKLGAAKTQVQANEASDVADKLGKLYARADKARVAEKEPHLSASRDVDDKWRPLTTAAGIYKRLKDAVVEPFLRAQKAAKDKAEREAREAADKARREAAEAAAAAERAAQAAAAKGDTAGVEQAARAAATAEAKATAAEATAMTVAATPITAGTRGRRTGLRPVTVVTITDRAKVLEFFEANESTRDQITALLQQMAEAAVKAKLTVPGVTVTKDHDAV